MTDAQLTGPDSWERFEQPALRATPFVMLVLSTAGAVAIDSSSTTKVALELGLAAGAAVWMAVKLMLDPDGDASPRINGVFLAGFTILSAALVVVDPVFGFFSWTGYLWTYELLEGRARLAGVLATATVTATSQHGGLPTGSAGSWISWIVIIAVNFAIAGAVGWTTWARDQQAERRKHAIEELTEANAKLEASVRENAGLHAQLLEQAREAGVLDERQRMAREIHDTLAQGLAGIITQLEAGLRTLNGDSEARRRAEAAARLARESLAEARRSVQALQPAPLEGARLPEAIAGVAESWSSLTGVHAQVTTTGSPRAMRPEIEVALLRTAQEALANVAKHADASRVVMTLSYMEDLVGLDVRDDGIGFASPRDGGFGLTAMRQRVHGLAGTLEIESEPGGGTAICASIPAIPVGGAA
jgi:signal transduction histidine kinase